MGGRGRCAAIQGGPRSKGDAPSSGSGGPAVLFIDKSVSERAVIRASESIQSQHIANIWIWSLGFGIGVISKVFFASLFAPSMIICLIMISELHSQNVLHLVGLLIDLGAKLPVSLHRMLDNSSRDIGYSKPIKPMVASAILMICISSGRISTSECVSLSCI